MDSAVPGQHILQWEAVLLGGAKMPTLLIYLVLLIWKPHNM